MDALRLPLRILASIAIAIAATFVILATVSADSASAACRGPVLKVDKRVVAAGGWVKVKGDACLRSKRGHRVRIAVRKNGRWKLAKVMRVRRNGHFKSRLRFTASRQQGKKTKSTTTKVTTAIKAVEPKAKATSKPVPITVVVKEDATSEFADPRQEGEGQGADTGSSSCPLNDPGYEVGATLPGCEVVSSDTVSNTNPLPFWGRLDCASSSRHKVIESGGDPAPTATGAPQGNASYRRLTALDGDDVWGERCEMGLNDHFEGPTALFKEGMRRVTYVSIRLPENFSRTSSNWKTVFQMKQTQPSTDDGSGPALEMQVRDGQWIVTGMWKDLWTAPARTGVWTRFMFDVTYSRDASRGLIQIAADLDGDGSFDGAGERSPRIRRATLATEVKGGNGIPVGGSIPSHLRAGIYQDPSLPCPAPSGCSTEIDNVQVVAP